MCQKKFSNIVESPRRTEERRTKGRRRRAGVSAPVPSLASVSSCQRCLSQLALHLHRAYIVAGEKSSQNRTGEIIAWRTYYFVHSADVY